MKFFSGALAAVLPVLLVPPAASASAPALEVEQPEGFDREFSPMPPAPGSDAVWPAAWTQFMERRDEYEESLEEGVRLSSQLAGNRGVGNYKMMVLLIRFADHDVADLPTKDEIAQLYNDDMGVDPQAKLVEQRGNNINPTGSLSEVFKVNSGGALNIEFVVTDWVSLTHDERYYASDEHDVGRCGKSKSLFEVGINEALTTFAAANPDFDWNQFTYIANEGNKMHGFGAIHSGHGAEFGGANQRYQIWSAKASGVKWTPPGVANGIVDRYYTTAANHGRPPLVGKTSSIMRFGTAAHEIGHSLGLPDLYDISNKGEGLGNYSVMAKGNSGFDNSGRYPTSFDPYCKTRLEWITPTLIGDDGVYEVQAGINQVFKIERGFKAGSGEYLLIENRQPIGYDSKMNGGGIAIYHVDEKRLRQNQPGYPGQPLDRKGRKFPENKQHYRVALLASDGGYELEQGDSEGKGADMLWSAESAMDELGNDNAVYPNTEQYQRGKVADTGIFIDDFSESDTTMTFRVRFLNPISTSEHDSPVALFTDAKQTRHLRTQATTVEGKDS